MAIEVRLFAALREEMGREHIQVNGAEAHTVAQVWQHISNGQPLPANTLCAVNMEYVDSNTAVQDGDEVAFFPPVTGG